LDGLKAWHPLHDQDAVMEIEQLAKKYNLILTGGSDFHGMYEGRENPLGHCHAPAECVDKLCEYL
jgi:hypothetical protein